MPLKYNKLIATVFIQIVARTLIKAHLALFMIEKIKAQPPIEEHPPIVATYIFKII